MTCLTDPVSECCSAPLTDETFGVCCSDCKEPSGPARCIDGTELPTDEQGMIVGSFLKAKVLALIVICMVAGAMFGISVVLPSKFGTDDSSLKNPAAVGQK